MSNTRPSAVRIIPPSNPLRGQIRLPGSKSVTNRALLLAALARGSSRLSGALSSDDTRYMSEALRLMGVTVNWVDETSVDVSGSGRLRPPGQPLFLGNAGTAMRFLTAAAATVDGHVILDGDEHMRKRPIAPLTASLRALGVAASDSNGCPPVEIHASGGFSAERVDIDGRLSSQYVSAILMAAACGKQALEVNVYSGDEALNARGYVDLTVALMQSFGATVAATGLARWRVEPTGYTANDCPIEPDASAATYLWAAEALTGGQINLGVEPATMTQPDARAHDLIARFPNLPPQIDGSQMQDAVPTLAVLAAFNQTPVRFTGIKNLRVKECDRVAALATELSRIVPGLGREDGDDLLIQSDPALAERALPAQIHTYSDHRIAMSFALAGLKIDGITVLDPGCVAKTYPLFWRDLAAVGVTLDFFT